MKVNLRKSLQKIGRMYKAELRSKIAGDNNVASGKMSNNIKFATTKNSLTFEFERYLGAISDGKKATGQAPSSEMVSKIAKWMQYKNLSIRGYRGRFQSKTDSNYRRAAFAIARSINRTSWKGSDVIMRAYKDIEENIDDEILDTFKTSIEQTIDKYKLTIK
tara:strand:- start:1825 stop:2310 length:486 start_codon:yes stop_codon:yes gene_type:complete